MAEAKTIAFFNRGRRTYDLGEIKKGETKRRVFPANSRLDLTETEAEQLRGYPDVIELSKMPAASAETDKLKADNTALAAENEKLKLQLAALPKPAAPAQEPAPQAEGTQPAGDAPAGEPDKGARKGGKGK